MTQRSPWLVNPLEYWPAVLVAAVILVVGVRLFEHPWWLMLPIVVVLAWLLAVVLAGRERSRLGFADRDLVRELQTARQQARDLAAGAIELQQEAQRLLTRPEQLDLLGTVQFCCDRVAELPQKLEEMARRLQGGEALLSIDQLQQQRKRVKRDLADSRGAAKEQLQVLLTSLERNIELAQQGADAREAQVLSLSTMIASTAGVLQQLQNKLRTADLRDQSQQAELRSLSEALSGAQANLDVWVGRQAWNV
jgi:chromosome segregation ATPase